MFLTMTGTWWELQKWLPGMYVDHFLPDEYLRFARLFFQLFSSTISGCSTWISKVCFFMPGTFRNSSDQSGHAHAHPGAAPRHHERAGKVRQLRLYRLTQT